MDSATSSAPTAEIAASRLAWGVTASAPSASAWARSISTWCRDGATEAAEKSVRTAVDRSE